MTIRPFMHICAGLLLLGLPGLAAAEDPRNHDYDNYGNISSGVRKKVESATVDRGWGRETVRTAPDEEEDLDKDTRGALSLDPKTEYRPKIRNKSGLTRHVVKSPFGDF